MYLIVLEKLRTSENHPSYTISLKLYVIVYCSSGMEITSVIQCPNVSTTPVSEIRLNQICVNQILGVIPKTTQFHAIW